jgi:hypothetical protein
MFTTVADGETAVLSVSLSLIRVDGARSELLETFPVRLGDVFLRGAGGLVFFVKLETWLSIVCVDDRMKSTTRCGILSAFPLPVAGNGGGDSLTHNDTPKCCCCKPPSIVKPDR